jgi:hypothetical protein
LELNIPYCHEVLFKKEQITMTIKKNFNPSKIKHVLPQVMKIFSVLQENMPPRPSPLPKEN